VYTCFVHEGKPQLAEAGIWAKMNVVGVRLVPRMGNALLRPPLEKQRSQTG
jgi:hypothetical protein